MPGYQTPLDICDRAAQHCRVQRLGSFSYASAQAKEMFFTYDKVRQAELERNLWTFATKRAVLRPVDTVTAVFATSAQFLVGALTLTFADTTGVVVGQLVTGTSIAAGTTVVSFVANTSVLLSIAITGTVASGAAITFGPLTYLWTPPTYSAATTYLVGQVVVDAQNEWWQSKVAANVGNTPDVGAFWSRYSGPDTMQTWNDDTDYFPGELALGSNGAVYLSLIARAGNEAHDPVTTTGFWRIVNGTATGLSILYPVGSGPWSDPRSSNVFRLPRGFLRQAPTDPRGGGIGWLGAPRGSWPDDMVREGDYIVSGMRDPMTLRYVADHADVGDWPAQFCEMLSARIAEECAPILTPDNVLQLVISNCRGHYKRERHAAMSTNGIEVGPIGREIDSYITCRA